MAAPLLEITHFSLNPAWQMLLPGTITLIVLLAAGGWRVGNAGSRRAKPNPRHSVVAVLLIATVLASPPGPLLPILLAIIAVSGMQLAGDLVGAGIALSLPAGRWQSRLRNVSGMLG